jgi:DNA-directed RNA polymerase alpha subunit
MKRSDLLQIRNFGEKSLNELYDRLRELDLLPAELDPDLRDDQASEDADKETETEAVTVAAKAEKPEEDE